MILVADVGGTKGQWLIDAETPITTAGINPVFHNTDDIIAILRKSDALMNAAADIKYIYYYGAACSSESRIATVSDALAVVFSEAKIVVEHDLMAAAVALYENRPTIACILGTGSNSCHFDGEKIVEVTPSLGFILGDEGSGAAFGKKLVQDYFYGLMPAEVAMAFEKEYEIDKDTVIDGVYRKPNPNNYLATFARFLSSCPDAAYISNLVRDEFDKFVQLHVCCYPDAKNCSVGFVGSIAYNFQEEMSAVLAKYGLQIGKIIRQPVFEIYKYHTAIANSK